MVWGAVAAAIRKLRYVRRLRGPFRHDGGHCWAALLPKLCHLADDAKGLLRSTLAVYENGVALPYAHSNHVRIRADGAGRYSHWRDGLFFSASDNSNPNTNGKTYTYSTSSHLHRPVLLSEAGVEHINFGKRDTGPEAIERDVAYALGTGSEILSHWLGGAANVRGKRVLEVGPGINFGSLLFVAAHGAVPMVADRFLAPWDPEYHPVFYRSLRDRIVRQCPGLDPRPLDAVIDAGDYPADIIHRDPSALESLTLPDGSVDLSYSNALLEHLDDFAAAFRQLYRVTRPGGWGVHQGDFRFHDSFDRPLEHLLLSGEEFEAQSRRCLRRSGTQLRPFELTALLEQSGFDSVRVDVFLSADPDYFREFLPRLRASRSPYCRTAEEKLRPLGALFRVHKPG